jgi:hypothetical protein
MTFTTKEYIKKLRGKIKEFKKFDRPLALAASTTHADYVNRIFVSGKTSAGGDIVPKKRTKGARQGAYSRSYAKRRQKRGRQTSFVNLVFEGLLFQNISNSLTRQGDMWVTGTTRKEETDKVTNLIGLYGRGVFLLSQAERKKALDVAKKEYFKIMKK